MEYSPDWLTCRSASSPRQRPRGTPVVPRGPAGTAGRTWWTRRRPADGWCRRPSYLARTVRAAASLPSSRGSCPTPSSARRRTESVGPLWSGISTFPRNCILGINQLQINPNNKCVFTKEFDIIFHLIVEFNVFFKYFVRVVCLRKLLWADLYLDQFKRI